MLTGTLWYGQFFFYNLGHVRMGNANTSWAIHMIMLVLFSNLVAVVFREWKGCRPRTSFDHRLGPGGPDRVGAGDDLRQLSWAI